MFNSKDTKKEFEEIRESSNIIGKGTTFKGNLDSSGTIRIESGGKVEGDIETKSKISTGESSLIDGNVIAANAEISGEITGVIKVSDLLILKSTAIIKGDIITGKLIIEQGAKFDGSCKMGDAALQRKAIKLDAAVGSE